MMNMGQSITAIDLIVLIAVVLALLFLVAWLCSSNLRAWIERPKYRFLADVEGYDRGVTNRK
jgi:hypothetical protein